MVIVPINALSQNVVVTDTLSQVQGTGLSDIDIEELRRPVTDTEKSGNNADLQLDNTLTRPELQSESMILRPEIRREELLEAPHFEEMPPSLVIRPQDIIGSYPLPAWENGYVYGYSSSQADMLYGAMMSANAGIRQRLGRTLTAQAEVGLQKYSVLYNTATVSGQLTWQPSPYFAITAFGAYSPGSFLSPVDIGPSFQWGGYLTLQTDTSVPFGIDVGARQTYDAMYGHELVPIVQPFIKLGGAKLGIDVGPMLKDAMRKKNGNSNGFNPIPQPIKALPPVAPRR